MLNSETPSNLEPPNEKFENRVKQTFTWMTYTFKKKLDEQAHLKTEVVGMQEDYEFVPQSLDLLNILTEKFTQNFHPTLIAAINEIKKENIRKDTFHLALLKKYLGVDFNEECNVVPEPNALCSIPEFNEEDNFVHLCFLQPFRLFSIKPDMRKTIRENHPKSECEWLLCEDVGSDIAPIFRAYTQLCLVSIILEDCAAQDNQYYCETIDENILKLIEIEKALKKQIEERLNLISVSVQKNNDRLKSEQNIQGNSNGLIDSIPIILIPVIPGFLGIARFYAIGRLIYGQPKEALHEALANNQVKRERTSFFKKMKFAFYWFFAHLNLSTSLFWSKLCLRILSGQYKSFKTYVTNTEADFFSFFIKSLLAIPVFFILAASPLLIIFPWIYGLTSLPFSLLRVFCVHGPFYYLRDYRFLKMIDVVEFLKDIGLFFWYIVPLFNMMLAIMTGLMPAFLISVGMIASHLFLSAIYFLTISGTDHSSTHIFTLVDSYFFRFFSSSLVIGIGTYLTIGIVGRQIYPWLPSLPERFREISRFFQRLFITQPNREDYEKEVGHIISKAQPVERIPMKENIVMPLEAEENERKELREKLLQIDCFNLTPEQQRMIRNCRTRMAESSSIKEIKAEMERARLVLGATLSQKEDLQNMNDRIEKMSEEKREVVKKDLQVVKAVMGRPNRRFLLSQPLVEVLQEQGHEMNINVLIPSPQSSPRW